MPLFANSSKYHIKIDFYNNVCYNEDIERFVSMPFAKILAFLGCFGCQDCVVYLVTIDSR